MMYTVSMIFMKLYLIMLHVILQYFIAVFIKYARDFEIAVFMNVLLAWDVSEVIVSKVFFTFLLIFRKFF